MKKRKFLLGLLAVSAIFGLASCAKEFTVSFETDGGSTVEAVIVTKNDALAIPETPTKGGYTFEGWYFDEALTQPVDFSSFVVEGNVTLYAKWSLNSYTVNFDTMGGSEVASQVVKHGESVQLPVAPTKEGYQFVGWYSKNDYSEVYANDAIKANTTLYAKWRSALRYAGTFEGEGKYNAENGTYTFTIQLELWGRVRIVYNNQVLSMDDEELLVSGAFTNNNQAPWTTELYCDIPDETSQEVDWTTLINSCNNPVKYVITYDPAGHTLDIQAEEILPAKPEIPTEGFYYEVYDNYKAFVTGGTIAAS